MDEDSSMNLVRIKQSAQEHNWLLAPRQPDKNFTRFTKGEKIIDVWHTGTVRYIPEPWAKAQHLRNNTEEDIENLFQSIV